MLMKLLGAPIGLPLGGFKFLLHTIQKIADEEMMDEGRIKEDLLLAQFQLDEGEITEEEYLEREAEIMVRYRAAREYRKQLAEQGRG
jgi:hypothetical protein